MTYVMLGGALGAAFRYLISEYISAHSKGVKIPIQIVVINWMGSFLLGLFVSLPFDEHMLLLLGTGFCGGFTTFSTFAFDTIRLFQNKQYLAGLFYLILTLSGSLLGVILGKLII